MALWRTLTAIGDKLGGLAIPTGKAWFAVGPSGTDDVDEIRPINRSNRAVEPFNDCVEVGALWNAAAGRFSQRVWFFLKAAAAFCLTTQTGCVGTKAAGATLIGDAEIVQMKKPKAPKPDKTYETVSPETRDPATAPIKVFKAGINAGRDGRSAAAATRS